MALEFRDSVTVSDIVAAKQSILDALNADKGKARVESDVRISATRGSQAKLRLIGGLLIDIKDFPVRLVVEFSAPTGQGDVRVTGYDDLGFGLMVGMEDKYQRAVFDIMGVAVNAVAHLKIAAPEPAAVVPGAAAPKNFCSNCGAQSNPTAKFCSGCGQPI